MTWRTQLGERTLKGAEAILIRATLAHVVDMVEEEIAGYAEPWEFGAILFDRLEPPARLALLAEVGASLLRDTEVCPKLTAINEAAVSALYCNIEQCIQFEIDCQDDMEDPFYWRRRVLAVFHEDGDLFELPCEDCTDWNEWDLLMEVLTERVLWDDDFNDADRYLDAPPEKAEFLRYIMTIDDEYYRAIPPDPRDSDLPQIRSILEGLRRE